MTSFQIYIFSLSGGLLEIASSMLAVSWALFVTSCIVGMAFKFIAIAEDRDCIRAIARSLKSFYTKALIAAVITTGITLFVPSTKTLTAMYVIPRIVNNENITSLPDNIAKYINSYIKEKTT